MRLLLISLLLLTACGGSGESSSTVPLGSCKALNSVWYSETDLAVVNFSALTVNNAPVEWGFTAADGLACDYYSNGAHALATQLLPWSHPSTPPEYTHYLQMTWSLPIGASCGYWSNPVNPNLAGAFVKQECNRLTLCRDVSPLTNCKTFR